MIRGRPREFGSPYQQQFEDAVRFELDRRVAAASTGGQKVSRSDLVRLIVSGLTAPIRLRSLTDEQRSALASRDRKAAAKARGRRRAKRGSTPGS